MMVAAAALVVAGGVLGASGFALGAATLVLAGRRWYQRADLTPQQLAKLKWQCGVDIDNSEQCLADQTPTRINPARHATAASATRSTGRGCSSCWKSRWWWTEYDLDHGAVGPAHPRPWRASLEHGELVAQDEDLDLLPGVGSGAQDHADQELGERHVDQLQCHQRIMSVSVRRQSGRSTREHSFGHPQARRRCDRSTQDGAACVSALPLCRIARFTRCGRGGTGTRGPPSRCD